MKTIIALKDFIVSKKLILAKLFLIVSLLVFFLPLIILPFFNHASADDYVCAGHLKEEGFLHYQSYFYNNWGGRFGATFFSSVFSEKNFLFSHYYLHSLILLCLDLFSIYFLIKTVNKYILKDDFIKRNAFFISIITNALFYCCVPDVCTFVFWFTSSMTHHLPLDLFYWEIISLIIFSHFGNSALKKFCRFLLPVFLFVMNGFSEVFVIIQFIILCILFFTGISKKYFILLLIFFLTGVFTASLAPGNFLRSQLIPQSGFLSMSVSVLFALMQVFWNIFRNPILWIALLIVFFYGNARKEELKRNNAVSFLVKHKWVLLFILLFFISAVIAVCAWGTKGKLVPSRYLNSACICTILLLTTFSFAFGVSCSKKILSLEFQKIQFRVIVVLALSLCYNNFIVAAYKSFLSAPAYDNIISEREDVFKNISAGKDKIREVKNYDIAFTDYMQKIYPHCSVTIYKWMQQKPEFLFYDNGDTDDYKIETLKEFYGFNSMIILRK